MSTLTYSPSSKITLNSLSEKSLHSLKYHQLLKLSAKYNIKKRWAKKDELIESILAVRSILLTNDCEKNDINHIKWTDGREMFEKTNVVNDVDKSEPSHRATFIIEKQEIDSRGTYNLASTINDILPDLNPFSRRLTFDVPQKQNVAPISKPLKSTESKKLTVPVSNRLTNCSRLKDSPLKLSNRSISIKKRGTHSPMKTTYGLKAQIVKPFIIDKKPSKAVTPIRNVEGVSSRNASQQKPRASLPRRKSKSDDPCARSSSIKEVLTPVSKTPPDLSSKRLQSLRNATTISGIKPISSSKMPNFAAIHQRQFNKLDSLDEYINKKSDRVKMLFGTPRQFHPVLKGPQHITGERVEEPAIKTPSVKASMNIAKKHISRNPPLRTMTDVKDKNRSHIHLIRSNRRFELQMKFRKMESSLCTS